MKRLRRVITACVAASLIGWLWEWWQRQPGPEIVIQHRITLAPEA